MSEAGLDGEELAEFAELLEDDRARTLERVGALTRDVAAIVEAARLTATDDEHDPEGATIAFERSQTGALLAAAQAHLVEIERARARIAAGEYGRCEQCGGAVAPDRLRARPAARTCIDCAARSPRR